MFYFAYGSNLNPERMKKRLGYLPKSSCAIIEGYKLKFNKQATSKPGVGYANIIKALNSNVEGMLYSVNSMDLKKLDAFEGVPNQYLRERVIVKVNQEEYQTETYIANQDKVVENLRPEAFYLDHILAGKNCMSPAYYQQMTSTITFD